MNWLFLIASLKKASTNKLIYLCFCFSMMDVMASEKKIITVGIFEGICPIVCTEGATVNKKNPGIIIETLSAIFNKDEITLHYIILPKRRTFHHLTLSKIDIAIGFSNAIQGSIVSTSSIYDATACAYVHSSSNLKYRKISDINNQSILVTSVPADQQVYNYIMNPENKITLSVVEGVNQNIRALQMIANKRADVAFISPLIANYLLSNSPLNNKIKQAGCQKETIPLHLHYSAINEGIFAKFDENIAELKKNGTIDNLVQRYINLKF